MEARRPPVPTAEAGLDVKVLLAVVVTVLAWASAFVVIRGVGDELRPGALSLGRLLVGAVALAVLSSLRRFGGGTRRAALRRLTVRERWLLVGVGLAWFAVYNVALNAGERHIDAGTAAMIIQIGPILIAALAGVALKEGFPRPLVVGGLVAFAGTLLIGVATSAGPGPSGPGTSAGLGVVLVLVSAVVYAAAMVAQKVVLRSMSGLQVTWVACTVGAVACLPFAGQLVHDLAAAPASVWWGVVYLGVVPTAIAFSTWAYALSRSSAGRLGITTFVVPPVAILLGWLTLGEVPLPLAVVGGAVSLVGVAITRRRPGAGGGRRRARLGARVQDEPGG